VHGSKKRAWSPPCDNEVSEVIAWFRENISDLVMERKIESLEPCCPLAGPLTRRTTCGFGFLDSSSACMGNSSLHDFVRLTSCSSTPSRLTLHNGIDLLPGV